MVSAKSHKTETFMTTFKYACTVLGLIFFQTSSWQLFSHMVLSSWVTEEFELPCSFKPSVICVLELALELQLSKLA